MYFALVSKKKVHSPNIVSQQVPDIVIFSSRNQNEEDVSNLDCNGAKKTVRRITTVWPQGQRQNAAVLDQLSVQREARNSIWPFCYS